MNKREKEVFQGQLDNEEKILSDLARMYRKALMDIEAKIRMLQSDELTQSRIYQAEYQKALKGQIEGILKKLHGDEYSTIQKYLSDTYTDAYVGTMYQMHGQGVPVIIPLDRKAAVKAVVTDSKLSVPLYASLGYDMDKLKKAVREEITRGLASSLPYEQIARALANKADIPMNRAKTIVRTEGHRIQQESADDARKGAKAKGADVVKQWDASLDGATRDTHRRLDGQIREIDEPFEANGKKAMYPGKFGRPEEDCNCRCVALTRARSALDDKELETLKERAEFFGLDKSEDFEDFKQKYLKAADQVKKSEEAKQPVKNKYGQVIVFDEKLNTPKWEKSVQYIKKLSNEYNTRLSAVGVGAVKAAGSVDMGGGMHLSSAEAATAFHEFAHSIAFERLTKYGVEHDEAFWKEIKAVRRKYRKDVGDDSSRWISNYEHVNDIDEFMAEAFTHAKMSEMGVELPRKYSADLTYSKQVLEIIDKYFKQKKQ